MGPMTSRLFLTQYYSRPLPDDQTLFVKHLINQRSNIVDHLIFAYQEKCFWLSLAKNVWRAMYCDLAKRSNICMSSKFQMFEEPCLIVWPDMIITAWALVFLYYGSSPDTLAQSKACHDKWWYSVIIISNTKRNQTKNNELFRTIGVIRWLTKSKTRLRYSKRDWMRYRYLHSYHGKVRKTWKKIIIFQVFAAVHFSREGVTIIADNKAGCTYRLADVPT